MPGTEKKNVVKAFLARFILAMFEVEELTQVEARAIFVRGPLTDRETYTHRCDQTFR